jgi:hypothetical protein
VPVLELAREIGCSGWARWRPKIQANASRHSALSYEHAGKIEAQLKAEVAELLARAEGGERQEARRQPRCITARRGPNPRIRST